MFLVLCKKCETCKNSKILGPCPHIPVIPVNIYLLALTLSLETVESPPNNLDFWLICFTAFRPFLIGRNRVLSALAVGTPILELLRETYKFEPPLNTSPAILASGDKPFCCFVKN